MPEDPFQAILDNIHSHDHDRERVQVLVYHVPVDGRQRFEELADRFEGRVELDRTIVILSGEDPIADERGIYLYCHVSRDLRSSYDRQVIIDKINGAYQRALKLPEGSESAVRRTFGPDFLRLFDDNNMLN